MKIKTYESFFDFFKKEKDKFNNDIEDILLEVRDLGYTVKIKNDLSINKFI